MTRAWEWLAAYAATHGLSYEPEADDGWLRAFEPFVTLRTPLRYEHAVHATGASGSVSIARLIVEAPASREVSCWFVAAQDVRLEGARAAAVSEVRPLSPFAEAIELVSTARRSSGDAEFDRHFATFANSDSDIARAVTPSLRKLVLSWRTPLHFEIRPGAFLLAPITLPPDAHSFAWLLGAVSFFGEKAARRVK